MSLPQRIALATLDGGAGKTAIAYALAVDLDFYLISNDDSIIEQAYDGAKIMENPILRDETVYDFGGFADANVINIIKECDWVIVPAINDQTSIMKANNTIKELSQYNNNFLVIGTRFKKDSYFQSIREGIQDVHPDIPVMPLRDALIFKDIQEYGVGVLDVEREDPKLRHVYRNSIREYKEIIKFMLGEELAEQLFMIKAEKGDE